MAIEAPVVEPLPSNTPAAPVVEPTVPTQSAAPQQASESELPEKILRVPAFQALFAGAPPAFSADIKKDAGRPGMELVVKNRDNLLKAGIGFYRSLKGDLGVLFNQMYVNGEAIKAADKAGKLLEIAPPFDAINAGIAKSGSANPVLGAVTPTGAAGAPIPQPPQFNSGGAGLPDAAQTKLSAARTKNMMPSSPTSGSLPGQGRVANAIFKQVV